MSHKVITVFEDRKQKVTLSQTQINDILTFRSIIGNQYIRLDYDGILQIMHYVGFIAKGKTRLQILPKIYDDIDLDSEKEIRESMGVLFNLLKVSEFNKVLHLPNAQNNSLMEAELLEIFISIFADHVFHTYSKRMNREYIEIEGNSQFVKGRIDFVKTIKNNFLRKDLHYISYQSFEHDNLINNAVKTVVVKLLECTQSADNKKNLKRALMFLDDAREIELSMPLLESVKFSRLNMDFKPVFDMARMFYQNLQPENYIGDETVFSFLIPVNDLYEYYLFKLIDGMEGYGAKHESTLHFAKTEDKRNILTIKPDILVYKGERLILVADAKYKNPGYGNGMFNNISRDDIYQVFAYGKAYGVKTVALIYPLFCKLPIESKTVIIKDSYGEMHLHIICVDIKNPDVEDVRQKLKEQIEASYCRI